MKRDHKILSYLDLSRSTTWDIVKGVEWEIKAPVVVQTSNDSLISRVPSKAVFHARIESRTSNSSLNQFIEKTVVQSDGILLLDTLNEQFNHETQGMEQLVAMIDCVKFGCIPREL